MRCKSCDQPLEANMDFCPNCGAPVAAASSAGAHTTLLPGVPRSADAPPVAAPTSYQQPGYQQPSYQQTVYQAPTYQAPTYHAPAYQPAGLPNSQAAVVSLIFGILGYVMLPFIGAIVAIVAGHIAKREIRDSGDRLGGGGMATAGLVLGYLQLGLVLFGFCAFIALMVIGAAAN